MKRLEYDRYGGPEVLRLKPFEPRSPRAREVVVKVLAASINPMDWKIRRGDMRLLTGFRFPRAIGTDFAGVVQAVGSSVSRFVVGDAVVGTATMKDPGAFASCVVADQNLIVKKPSALSFAEAACLPIAGVTAWCVLTKEARLKAGQRLFVNGAMGAVGQAAVSLARSIGADVVGRVGSDCVEQGARAGLSAVLDYTRPLPRSLDASFDVVFDCSGHLSATEGSRLLKRGGKVLDIAPTSFKFLSALVWPSRKVAFSDPRASNLQQVVDMAARREIAIKIARTVSLEEAPSVMAALEDGELHGKTVILL